MTKNNPRRFVRMFQPRFADLVERGEKCQTIRPTPKRMPEPGDVISLRCWTGKPYRSKHKILREARIVKTTTVTVTEEGVRLLGLPIRFPDLFARADGFEDMPELIEWFGETHGLPFKGVCIYWDRREWVWSEKSKEEGGAE